MYIYIYIYTHRQPAVDGRVRAQPGCPHRRPDLHPAHRRGPPASRGKLLHTRNRKGQNPSENATEDPLEHPSGSP